MASEYSHEVICQKCGAKLHTYASGFEFNWHDMAYCERCHKTWDTCCDEAYRHPMTAEEVELYGGKA